MLDLHPAGGQVRTALPVHYSRQCGAAGWRWFSFHSVMPPLVCVSRSPYPSPRHGGHEGDSPSRRRQSAYDMPLIMPASVSPDAADLIVRLLARRPENRLGASFGDFKLLMVCASVHANAWAGRCPYG